MTRHFQSVVLAVFFALVLAPVIAAQGTPPAQSVTTGPDIIPLRVQIVVARYQGEKKISSLPYIMSVNANQAGPQASLRMGAQVPLRTPSPDGKTSSFNYRDIGTSIDCSARSTPDGRFWLTVSIEESSVYGEASAGASSPAAVNMDTPPAFRSFRSTNMLILKDGQNSQFTTATDRISGETVRVDVTLNVMK